VRDWIRGSLGRVVNAMQHGHRNGSLLHLSCLPRSMPLVCSLFRISPSPRAPFKLSNVLSSASTICRPCLATGDYSRSLNVPIYDTRASVSIRVSVIADSRERSKVSGLAAGDNAFPPEKLLPRVR